MDAEEWIERLTERLQGKKLARLWLPHDARAKTFAARNSPVEQFISRFGTDVVRISPLTKKEHSINAGQVVMRRSRFNKTRCAQGLSALRAWQYAYDQERKQYSRAPVDDWAADAADAFCEGAKVMQERVIEAKAKQPVPLHVSNPYGETLNDLWRTAPQLSRRI